MFLSFFFFFSYLSLYKSWNLRCLRLKCVPTVNSVVRPQVNPLLIEFKLRCSALYFKETCHDQLSEDFLLPLDGMIESTWTAWHSICNIRDPLRSLRSCKEIFPSCFRRDFHTFWLPEFSFYSLIVFNFDYLLLFFYSPFFYSLDLFIVFSFFRFCLFVYFL